MASYLMMAFLLAGMISFAPAQEWEEGACDDVDGEVDVCYDRYTAVADSQPEGEINCGAAQELIDCVLDIENKCWGHANAHYLRDFMIYFQKHIETSSACVLNIPPEEILLETNSDCPPSVHAFNVALNNCHQPVLDALPSQEMCQPLKEVLECAEGLIKACQGSRILDAEALMYLDLTMNHMRKVRKNDYGCQDD